MARVYVSSTYQDLKEYREQVRLALQTMGHEAVAMETYGARDDRPVDLCLRDVAACDLYVGIVAWRYGHVPDDHDHSITELEYRQAVASGKPRLVFLAEKAGWPFDRVEVDALGRVNAFREELGKNRVVKFFTSAAELRGHVGEAVATWEREQGLAPAKARTDWEAYRQAVIEKHRWVNLEVSRPLLAVQPSTCWTIQERRFCGSRAPKSSGASPSRSSSAGRAAARAPCSTA
jgi:hypothetical protein